MKFTLLITVECTQCLETTTYKTHPLFPDAIDRKIKEAIAAFNSRRWTELPGDKWICPAHGAGGDVKSSATTA